MALKPLPPQALYRRCTGLPFESTAELADVDGPLGQERAMEALKFGTGLPSPGYHIFALGPAGVGKRTLTTRTLERAAATQPPADDWCYLNNFSDPQKPRALRLPAGRGAPFKRDMEQLIEDLRASIPAGFESDEYRMRLQVLEKQLAEERDKAMGAVQARAAERNVTVVRTPMGFAVAPVCAGEVLDPEKFRQLPEEDQQRIQKDIGATQEELQAALRGMPQLERNHRDRVKELNREMALYAVGHLVDELRQRHADAPGILSHLEAVQADVIENVRDFLGSAETEDAAGQIRKLFSESPALRRYGVNLMVDNAGARGRPVVREDLPSYGNLAGRMEHHSHFGMLITDFTLIRPGALHRANGGYLVLDARRLLSQPLAWEYLKAALEARQIRIDPPERLHGLSATASLEPGPIPLEVKVVLLGDRYLYHLLAAYDPEFQSHFKVAADFEDAMPRDGNELQYAKLVATLARADGLRPFSGAAVACAIERASRLAEDSAKLTTQIQAVEDLLREADACAASAGRQRVEREDVQGAIDGQIRRQGRTRERLLEQITRGTRLIDTQGEKVGQVNGLSVVQLGQFAFGTPSRITARVRLGKGEVVDIEREVDLGGPIHSKGVLILSSLLASRYASDRPFSLSASLVFEQSYGGVDGDSASSAELYALLSALSGLPIRQSIAVTGSVNQLGQVQAIGGVNEKIEGFFDVCRARGLSGDQGVLIPAANAKDLMLREDVVEACASAKFHVWTADDVDQGFELLTGVAAGARGADGAFPDGSANARVAARLEQLAEVVRTFSSPPAAAAKVQP